MKFSDFDEDTPRKSGKLSAMAGSTLICGLLAIIIILVTVLYCVRVERIAGDQVGVMLNKINGKMTIINQSGMQIFNGITTDLYLLDKTLQTLEMTENPRRGNRRRKDDLKIKTKDGSDVYLDLTVQYRIDPDMADVVLETSGPGDNYKQTWSRDYVRSISRNYLGELTTEEFYDSNKRNKQLDAARQQANKSLQEFGLVIDDLVIPQKPHFYEEYEKMIKDKKIADQSVQEEKSKALAAEQRQEKSRIVAGNQKEIAIVEFSGKMEQKVIKAKAEAEKLQRGADAYYDKVTIAANAEFYRKQKDAEAVLMAKQKDAEGIEELKKALEGEGGRNMVMLEYAKKLKNLKITGKPFIIEGTTERFEHTSDSTASASSRRGK